MKQKCYPYPESCNPAILDRRKLLREEGLIISSLKLNFQRWKIFFFPDGPKGLIISSLKLNFQRAKEEIYFVLDGYEAPGRPHILYLAVQPQTPAKVEIFEVERGNFFFSDGHEAPRGPHNFLRFEVKFLKRKYFSYLMGTVRNARNLEGLIFCI